MSITAIIALKVEDFGKFEASFAERTSARVAAGIEVKAYRDMDDAGKVVVISSVPSLDTPVCEQQTRRFNEEAADLDAVILSISMDLPFAASRFCDTHGIDKVVTLSDYQDKAFGNAYGLLIKELQLLARAVHVVDTEGNIAHAEIVGEVTDHPDYDQVLEVIKGL